MRSVEYDDIIANIKRIISQKGMKQVVVAERAGLSPSEFSNILNDRRKLLRVEHLPALANALGVKLSEFYEVEERKEVG